MGSYQMDLKVKDGCTLEMVFNAMKKMQESGVADNSVTLSCGEEITITGGFYEDFDEVHDLILSIVWKDKGMVKNHVRSILSKYVDTGVIPEAIDNICKSLANYNCVLSKEEKEELLELCNARQK